MPTISIEGFDGIVPRSGPSRLGADSSTIARNVKLQSGELRPWRMPVKAFAPVTPDCLGIYRLVNYATSASQWLEFPCDVDVVGSPMADASDFRIYYTGATIEPRKTNWAMANAHGAAPYPNTYYEMGTPGPTATPTLSASSSSGTAEVRAYVFTYVTVFGAVTEESAPSPGNTVTVTSSGATVTVGGFGTPPAGNYNYQYINIYRSVTGTQTVSYQFVAQIPISQTSYVDALTVTQLGAALTSTFYTPPPAGMTGLVEMPNGMLAGFIGNQIWFCQPYYPHAWPVSYMLTVEFPIVGLGVFGNSLFVGTTKNPYLITGTSPASMSQEKLPIIQACVSKRSIVSDQWGVVYASPNGLLAVGPGVQDIVTQTLYTRDEWQALLPQTMVGVLYNNMYIGFYSNGFGPTTAIVYSRADRPALTTYDYDANCVFVERATGNIYAVSQQTNICNQLDADPVNNTIFQWQSRMYIMPTPTSFGCMKLEADYTEVYNAFDYQQIVAADIAADEALFAAYAGKTLGGCLNDVAIDTYAVNGSILNSIPTAQDTTNVQVILFADGAQVFSASMQSDAVIRLPAGFKATLWEVLITGNASVRKFCMATTMRELNSV